MIDAIPDARAFRTAAHERSDLGTSDPVEIARRLLAGREMCGTAPITKVPNFLDGCGLGLGLRFGGTTGCVVEALRDYRGAAGRKPYLRDLMALAVASIEELGPRQGIWVHIVPEYRVASFTMLVHVRWGIEAPR